MHKRAKDEVLRYSLTATLHIPADASEKHLIRIAEALDAVWVTRRDGSDRLTAELTVTANTAEAAIAMVVSRCEDNVKGGYLLAVSLSDVVAEDADLVGVAELSDLLQVSVQRASTLARSPGFPAPIAMLRSGPIWHRPTVARFLSSWKRRPGRPSVSRRQSLKRTQLRRTAPNPA